MVRGPIAKWKGKAGPGDTGVESIDGLELVDLPAEPQAASVTHRGPASEIADAWQTMDVALEQRGLADPEVTP